MHFRERMGCCQYVEVSSDECHKHNRIRPPSLRSKASKEMHLMEYSKRVDRSCLFLRCILAHSGVEIMSVIRRGIKDGRLQDQALLALSTLSGEKGSTSRRFENFANTLVGFGRAFEVLVGANLLSNFLTLRKKLVPQNLHDILKCVPVHQ